MASDGTVRRFLMDFKKALNRGDWEIVERRVEYAQQVEMPIEAIKIKLLHLTLEDYHSGPEEDRERPGEFVWIFHKDDDENQPYWYVKLKLEDQPTGKKWAKVISFHHTIYPN